MFWGIALKPGASHTLKEEEGSLLHLSTACLHEPKDASKGSLQIKTEEGAYTIAVLEKDKHDMATFDLFFNTMAPPTFFNNSKNEVHLTGYFEMDGEADEDMMSDMSDEEETVSKIQGVKKSAKAAKPVSESEDDEEDDDEEDDEELDSDMEGMEGLEDDEDDEDDDEDDEDDEEDDEDDEEEDEESEEEVKPAAKQVVNKNNKRPIESAAPAAKAQKTSGTSSTDSYVKQVSEFLKKNGKTTIGMIGAKVKKPEDLPKLKQFLLTRKEFKISGDNIEIA